MRTTHLPIVEPCHEDWNAMERGERGRFCQICVKNVYDLSSMTETEARRFLSAQADGSICVRYRYDDRGQVRFRPSSPTNTCAPPRRLPWAGALIAAATVAACTPHAPEELSLPDYYEESGELMGGFTGTPTPKRPEPHRGQLRPLEEREHAIAGMLESFDAVEPAAGEQLPCDPEETRTVHSSPRNVERSGKAKRARMAERARKAEPTRANRSNAQG